MARLLEEKGAGSSTVANTPKPGGRISNGRPFAPLPRSPSVNPHSYQAPPTVSNGIHNTSSASNATQTPFTSPTRAEGAAVAGVSRPAPNAGFFGAKRGKGNDGNSFGRPNQSLSLPPVLVLLTFPTPRRDALIAARALMAELMPGTDPQSILSSRPTMDDTTYSLMFKNTASGAAIAVAKRFVEVFQTSQDGRLKLMKAEFPPKARDVIDAMVNGHPIV